MQGQFRRGSGGCPASRWLQIMQIGDRALCLGGGLKDEAVVVLQHRKPRCQIASMIRARLQFGHDAEVGRQKHRPELGDLS